MIHADSDSWNQVMETIRRAKIGLSSLGDAPDFDFVGIPFSLC